MNSRSNADLMSINSDGDSYGSGESEISQLDHSHSIDEKILGLEITVDHSTLVTEAHSLNETRWK